MELFRRAHGDKCYLQRNNKQKESIDDPICPSNKVDAQERPLPVKEMNRDCVICILLSVEQLAVTPINYPSKSEVSTQDQANGTVTIKREFVKSISL